MPGKVVVLVGPTAVGKSALALDLAQHFAADVITADSRQVYRYMDIGTAKPTPEERARVPHYMIDLVEPSDTYTAGLFREEATRLLRRIHAAGRLALVVGGTGFYLRALLDGLAMPSVSPDPDRRARYLAEVAELGPAALHGRLAAVDPVSASRIHPNNIPRVVRALEIAEALERPVPVLPPARPTPALYLGLSMDRRRLIEVADRRVLRQIDAGLVDETRLLLDMGYDPDCPALSGLGYRETVAHLSRGLTLADAIQRYQFATHRYIRRQLTWFRADKRIRWIEAEHDPHSEAVRLIDSWIATDASEESPALDAFV